MKSFINWVADMVFPARCLGCEAYGSYLCASCRATLPTRDYQECIGCARATMGGVPCHACAPDTDVDRLLIAGRMDHELLSTALYALKYRGIAGVVEPLADYLVSGLSLRKTSASVFWPNPLLTAVPLHPRRRRERGFNQSDLLARRVAQAIAMEYAPDVLARTRHTASQVSTHSRKERLENMRDAFTIRQPKLVLDRDIVLLDDVCTTGATLQDCARALKHSGARSVTAIVLARG